MMELPSSCTPIIVLNEVLHADEKRAGKIEVQDLWLFWCFFYPYLLDIQV